MTHSEPAIEARALTRRFGEVTALDDVSLSVGHGEFFSLLGPSGCGKTTLLRILAGLDTPDAGELRLAGVNAARLPAHERHVNTVFQSYALFPHLTVRENVAFGLRMKRVPRPETEARVRAMMDLTRIADLAGRRPAELSGGQKQRVALARALVNEPRIVLLDEPLAALDLKLRHELQHELRQLQRRMGVTFLYVTHDQDEALSMSDRIAVMDAGRIVQLGTGEELYERPRTRFVAQFLGGCNLLPAAAPSTDDQITTPLGPLRIASPTTGRSGTLAIRPERIVLAPDGGPNCVPGEVIESTYTGAETRLRVRAGGELLSVTLRNGTAAPRPVAGGNVFLSLPPEALIALED